MSRSSGPQLQPGARPLPAGNNPDQDPRAWQNVAQRPAATHQQQAYAQQQGYQGQQAPHDPYAQPQAYPYGQGHQDLAYGRGPDQGYAQPAAGQYPSHLDPFGQPSQPQQYGQQQGYAASAGYTQPQPQGHAAHQAGQQPAHALRGQTYDQWQNAVPDTRGFDLASYQHPAVQQQYAQGYAGGHQQSTAADWNAHEHFGTATGDPSLDPNVYGVSHPQGGALEQTYAEDDGVYEDEEPRRGAWVKIAAVLALAIAVGGGGIYAYNALFGVPSKDGKPPLVKNEPGPSKVKPPEPGGMKFDHADSKIMGRLGDSGAAAEATASTDVNGARKVSTLVVNPDGSIQAPEAAAAPADPAPAPTGVGSTSTGVPGLSIVDVSGPRPVAVAPPPAPAPEPTKVSTPAQAEKPVIISKAQPSDAALELAPAPPAKKAAPVETAAPVEKPVEKKVAVAQPVGPKPTGAGYVAVLASIPATGSSQLDALKQFADLKTKYSTLLADKTPEVQVANLGEKGTYHRLLVGPPGSQESVKQLCSGLKAAGYAGCWPLAY